MTDTSTSVRDVLLLPEGGDAKQPAGKWKDLQDKLREDVKGVKWVAMPDLVARIGELLDMQIPDLLLAAWKKCDELQTALEESKKSPQSITYVGLADHTINSEHNPYIEVRISKAPPRKIEFKLKLVFKLKACELKIQGGLIKQARPGACELEGTFSQGTLVLATKKLAPIHLPGAFPSDQSVTAREQQTPVKGAAAV
jgi:hypothetical protein